MTEHDPLPERPLAHSGVVALVGRPNVGKSTLLNRLIGHKVAIVSDKPQTTRNQIAGILDGPDRQLVFLDTPGIHRPQYRLNQRMMAIAKSALEGVDVIAALTDVGEPFGGGDQFVIELLRHRPQPVVLVVNKIDAVAKSAMLPVIDRWAKAGDFADVIPISARDGDSVDILVEALATRLPPGPALYPPGVESDVSERFLAAEIIREKVLRRSRDELPYSTSVLIEDFADEGGVLQIYATILVEREGQKAILIGRGGQSIKAIGTAARSDLQNLLDRRVFLDLRVRARPAWRDDERLLDRLGLPR